MTLNDEFAFQLDAVGIQYEREFAAIPNRRFRYDFKVGDLLIELQGGIYAYKPSHTSAKAIRRDAEKTNLATLHGYRILHFTSDMVRSGEALKMVEMAFDREPFEAQIEELDYLSSVLEEKIHKLAKKVKDE